MAKRTALDDELEALLTPTIEAMGFEVIRVRLLGNSPQILQIMAERPDGTISVDECANISRAVSAVLDVEDPVSGNYTLEVSSPGIDRPLTRLKDFDRFDGLEAKIELKQAVDGQRRFRGRLDGVEGDEVRLVTEQGILGFALEMIDQAKLVMNDELLKMAGASQSDADSQ
ncbi:MAG: ribosome maturation factor RimP [Alphaproteobacteria bacterium]